MHRKRPTEPYVVLVASSLLLLVAGVSARAAFAGPEPAPHGDPRGDATATSQGPTWPPVVAALEGDWEGSGTLFGSAASFTMSWERSLNDQFLRLTFGNALVTDDGNSPVLAAEAFYRAGADGSLTGYWFDTRGEVVTLRARVTDDRIVTDWQASSESGRTTYRVVDADTVEVVDEVRGANGLQEFGRATYARRR